MDSDGRVRRGKRRRTMELSPAPLPTPFETEVDKDYTQHSESDEAILVRGWLEETDCDEPLASRLDALGLSLPEAERCLERECEHKKQMMDSLGATDTDHALLDPATQDAMGLLRKELARARQAWNELAVYDGMEILRGEHYSQLEEVPHPAKHDEKLASILESRPSVCGYEVKDGKVKRLLSSNVEEPASSSRPTKKKKMDVPIIDLTLDDSKPETSSRPQPSRSAGPSLPLSPPDSLAAEGSPSANDLELEPELCEEQLRVVNVALKGENIFYTGSAGCGKSTVLRAIKKRFLERGWRVRVLAPTGMVALANGGDTIYTYAGWTPDHMKYSLDYLRNRARGEKNSKRFTETDVIIIDEISMVENMVFERLDEVLRAGRNNPTESFGGVQVIVTGDFCQLPPVDPFQYCISCRSNDNELESLGGGTHQCTTCGRAWQAKDKWAFRSTTWAGCNFRCFHLGVIHRQRDAEFKALLEQCRLGLPFSNAQLEVLRNHPLRPDFGRPVRLFSTTRQVHNMNAGEFKKLGGTPVTYECHDKFDWKDHLHPHLGQSPGDKRRRDGPEQSEEYPLVALKKHRYEEKLEIKERMLVMLVVNLDKEAGLCNGSQGEVIGFDSHSSFPTLGEKKKKKQSAGPLTKYAERQVTEFSNRQPAATRPGGQVLWPVVRFHNGVTRTIAAHCSISELGDGEPHSLLSRTQVPLVAAWAISIHKAQGMTLDRVEVHLDRAFEEGQVYVALSRATALEGLKVVASGDGLNSLANGGNPQVTQFLVSCFPELRERFPALGRRR